MLTACGYRLKWNREIYKETEDLEKRKRKLNFYKHMFRMNSERLEQIFDKLYIEKPWRICGADEVGTGKTLNHEVGQAGMSLDKSCYK